MKNIDRKITIIGLLWVVSIPILYGYNDANIWRYAEYGSQDIYTVPAGQSFWLYGMLFSVNGDFYARLLVDNTVFWNVNLDNDSWGYQFSIPIRFQAGSTFRAECGQWGRLMIYGYEGTSNPIENKGTQQSNVMINPKTEIYPTPFSEHTMINYQVPKRNLGMSRWLLKIE